MSRYSLLRLTGARYGFLLLVLFSWEHELCRVKLGNRTTSKAEYIPVDGHSSVSVSTFTT
jgi:hypothetical protein